MMIALGIFMFILLVIAHEFGHFIMAKKSGVEVEEFGIGFPPRIAGRRFGNDKTLYSINLLPIGGFVKLKGEHDEDKSSGSYGATSFKKKTIIILAGVVMNFLVAGIILSILSWSGVPKILDNQFAIGSDTKIARHDVLITYVEENSPAQRASIKVGDRLISINNVVLGESSELSGLTEANAGQTIPITYQSDNNQAKTVSITLNQDNEDSGYLGVIPGDFITEKSTWSAPIRGFGMAGQFAWLTLSGVATTFGQLLSGHSNQAAENVTGPVGIVFLLNDVSKAGISFVMLFIALISVTLAVINVLPVPALDGGRLFVSGIYKLLKKPLHAKTEERIHGTGMVILLALVALITVVDVRRFF